MSRPRGSIVTAGPVPASAGIGLRFQHHRAMVDRRPAVAWLEVHTENYMGGGRAREYLTTLRRDYPVSCHGVGLSLGSANGLDHVHLQRTRDLVDWIEPGFVSEHLSWSVTGGIYLADLLPLPMTEEALDTVCRHVDQVQSCLRRAILIENPSSYLRYRHSTIPEWEFLATVASRTGCGILCDVNNIYVSAENHGFDAMAYLDALPVDRVAEIHLAGHAARTLDSGRVLRIDDHGSRVCGPVWDLYGAALARFGRVATLIEWDTNVPDLDTLLNEAAKAERCLDTCPARQSDAAAA